MALILNSLQDWTRALLIGHESLSLLGAGFLLATLTLTGITGRVVMWAGIARPRS